MPVDDLLNKLPKNTPIWAVGIVSVLVTLFTGFIFGYMTIKDEVVKGIDITASQISKKQVQEDMDKQFFRDIVSENIKQITTLSKAVDETGREVQNLSGRVVALEKDVSECNTKLSDCENRGKSGKNK